MVVRGGEDRESKSFFGVFSVVAVCGLLVFSYFVNKTSCFLYEINSVKLVIFL